MSDEPRKRSLKWIGWITWTAVALLILYPLSIGPALWLTDDSYSGWQAIGPVYRPLYWLANRFECVGNAMYWYMTCWVDFQESG